MASIEKQPNGRYKVRYRTPDGKDRAERFDKKREALDFAASVRVDKKRSLFAATRLRCSPVRGPTHPRVMTSCA